MDAELTPIANVAFNGVVADEINRLMRHIKQLVEVGDRLADWALTNVVCTCRRDWQCQKCSVITRWEELRRGDR